MAVEKDLKLTVSVEDKEALRKIAELEKKKLSKKKIDIEFDSTSIDKAIAKLKSKLSIPTTKLKFDIDKVATPQTKTGKINISVDDKEALKEISKLKSKISIPATKLKVDVDKITTPKTSGAKINVSVDSKEALKGIAKLEKLKFTNKKINVDFDSSKIDKAIAKVKSQSSTLKVKADIEKITAPKTSGKINVSVESKEALKEIAKLEKLKFTNKKINVDFDSSKIDAAISKLQKKLSGSGLKAKIDTLETLNVKTLTKPSGSKTPVDVARMNGEKQAYLDSVEFKKKKDRDFIDAQIINAKRSADERKKIEKSFIDNKSALEKAHISALAENEKRNNILRTVESIKQKRIQSDNEKRTGSEQRRDQKILFTPVKSVDLSSANSLKQQVTYWKQIRDAAANGSKEFKTADGHIQRLTNSLKNAAGQSKGLSIFQKLEVGENITTIGIGLGIVGAAAFAAVGFVKDLAIGLAQVVERGAGLGVLQDAFVRLSGGAELAEDKLQLLRQASAGNLGNEQLELYANKMALLGISAEDSAKQLDLVERRSDEMGVSFEAGSAALQTFTLTGRATGLKELGLNAAKVTTEVERLAVATGKTTKDLSDEEVQTLRITAVNNLFGDSLTNISAKQKDAGDKIASLKTGFQNFKEEVLIFISQVAAPLVDGLLSIRDEFQKQLFALGFNKDAFDKLKKSVIDTVTQGVNYLVDAYKSNLLPAIIDVIREVKNFLSQNPAFIGSVKDAAKSLIDLTLAFDKVLIGGLGKFISLVSSAVTAIKPLIDLAQTLATTLRDIATLRFDKLIELFNTDQTIDVKVNTTEGDKRVSDRIEELVKRDAEQQGANLPSKEDFEANKKVKSIGSHTGSRQRQSDTTNEVKLTNELIDKENELLELLNKEASFTADQRNQLVYINFLTQVRDLRNQIAGLKIPDDVLKITAQVGIVTPTKENERNIEPQLFEKEKKESFAELRDKLLSAFSEATSSIQNIMGIFNLGAETAIAKILDGFSKVLTIVQTIVALFNTIQTVKSIFDTILSFIPGGGLLAAAAGAVGGSIGPDSSNVSSPRNTPSFSNLTAFNNAIPSLTANYRQSPTIVNIYADTDSQKFYQSTYSSFVNRRNRTRIAV